MPIQVTRETHEAPEYVQNRLTLAGGRNRFGEPNYRVVWGWNRLTPIGGLWEDKGTVEVRHEPKYPQVNRWHIEKWVAPEVYGSPEFWEMTTKEEGTLALGPYPHRGEYEHCFTLEGPKGEFIQLTPTVVEYIARAIESSRSKKVFKSQRRDREHKNEDKYVDWCMDQMSDTATWSYTPHTYLPAKIKEKMNVNDDYGAT